ncbi:nucleotide exchange factor GrpE [Desulfobacterota bacterium AH_259_B03_O07]|nr:nucleotide exchange factor GrpE [Desulfobacterota bacterium AH_259_B03_O07]
MKTSSNGDQQDNKEVETKLKKKSKEGQNLSEDDYSSGPKSLEEEFEKIDKEYNELNEQYLRLAAEFENYKKRVTKEKADLIAYGNEELIKSLLGVLDNLERAVEHSESNKDSEPIIEGIKLVQKQFLVCLEKFGAKSIEVRKGDEFDPNLHQAVEREKSNEVKLGFILSEMLKGYTLKERLLRPALVSVSEGDGASSKKEQASIDSVLADTKPNGNTNNISDLLDSDTEKK